MRALGNGPRRGATRRRPLGPAALSGALALGALLGPVQVARAGSMDFALERLVTDESCRTADGQIGSGVCAADNDAFKRLVSQYAMAIAPTAMGPARTTGYGGFEIVVEGAYTSIDSSADYWRRGTRGSPDPTTGVNGQENASPASLLQLYSVRLRKGFGFGWEMNSQFGFLPDTSIITGGVDLRYALFEGFRTGALGYVPDIAAAGSVRTITGTSQVQLTVASAQAVMSKPFAIAQTGQLTPWVGFQYLWIFGDSGVIDFTPGTDALQYCNYTGPNQPGGPRNPAQPDRDGSPVCDGGSMADFNNSQLFMPVRLERQRLFFGLNYQYEILTVGAQVSVDVVSPENAQNDAADSAVLAGQPNQTVMALQLGTIF